MQIPIGDTTRIVIKRHAFEQMYSWRISEEEIERIISTGAIIENYPDDYPFPSFLFCGHSDARLLHVVAAYNHKNNEIIIITLMNQMSNTLNQVK
jgi:hypothetical protein